ncbi:MAG: hypothetical protein QG663_1039, partial [Thermodesulfobacteriota bacterium]|nr:hypothetical protein [Thermodesulfobacteriota bacterium]
EDVNFLEIFTEEDVNDVYSMKRFPA